MATGDQNEQALADGSAPVFSELNFNRSATKLLTPEQSIHKQLNLFCFMRNQIGP